MSKIVPLISSGIAGPLGVIHLPRLWLKVSLEACGKLADGYPGIGQGFRFTLGAGAIMGSASSSTAARSKARNAARSNVSSEVMRCRSCQRQSFQSWSETFAQNPRPAL